MSKFITIFKKLYLNTIFRRSVLILVDALVIFICLSFLSNLFNLNSDYIFLILTIFIGTFFYIFTGQYSSFTKYQSRNFLYITILRNSIFTALIFLLSVLLKENIYNLSFYFCFLIFITFSIYSIRIVMRDILIKFNPNTKNIKHKKNVAIYGAGEAGIQLARALNLANTHNLKFFIDDNSNIWNRYIDGIPIKSRKYLLKKVKSIDQLLIAIPSLNKKDRKKIIHFAQTLKIPILKVPSLKDIYSGVSKINTLKHIEIEDILGRESVKDFKSLIKSDIFNSIICVTGAGGSIGSELCAQLVKLNPYKIILIEQSEHALYQINNKLSKLKNNNTEIISFLGNCSDISFLENIFNKYQIKIILHAAAYKHVPIVEKNPLTGIANNVFSTRELCLTAIKFNVKKMMFISTDKAVRPSSIMGASKRLAELIMIYFSLKNSENYESPCFSMVRFGNVLGSSGSVVPLFNKQISEGGPITITHPDVVRYFMTIEEAAQLVIQATILGKGGDLFHLDMGDQVSIKHLAYQLVQLRGLTIKDKNNPNGDIEIKFTGLRDGEKLYEELLINGNSKSTSHPYIYRVDEEKVYFKDFWNKLLELEKSTKDNDLNLSLQLLKEFVPEWDKSN